MSQENSVRAAFWSNIFNSDYTLCIRGGGNFSYRFYEVLAAGRIPLFVNTRCVLPFDNEIDWRRHCVWVEEQEMDRIGEIVREFHSRISREEFHALQMANRRLWETRLEPLSFYVRLDARHFTPAGNGNAARHGFARGDLISNARQRGQIRLDKLRLGPRIHSPPGGVEKSQDVL